MNRSSDDQFDALIFPSVSAMPAASSPLPHVAAVQPTTSTAELPSQYQYKNWPAGMYTCTSDGIIV